GASASFTLGSFSDPGVNDGPWAVDVNWGDGSPHTTFNTSTQGTLTAQTHTYADGPSAYPVTVQVTDRDGGARSVAFQVSVGNRPPAVSNNLATQSTQYSDPIQPVTVSARDCPGDLASLAASTAWSKDGGSWQPGLPPGFTLTPGGSADP